MGEEINQIGFETYKGHKATFGHAKGSYFTYHFPHSTFVAARGAFGKFLDFICFRVVRLPDHHIKLYVIISI